MTCSVIVVSYNSRAFLPACLAAVTAQLGPDDELIVVDNGSTDGSPELVARHFPAARLFRGPNTGYAGGNNHGAAAARGDVLVFLNPDTVAGPGAIAALTAPLRAESGPDLTTACIVLADRPDTVNACGNTIHYTGLTYCRGAGRLRAELAAPAEVGAISGAAFAIGRELFHRLGGFDEQFFMYVEDTDLSWRARLAGCTIRYVPEAVVAHAYTFTYGPAKAYHLERNRHLMLLKNLAWDTYLRMLPALLLAELLTGGYLLLRGYWGVKPRAYAWLWRNRAALLAARRQAQALRRRSDAELLAVATERLAFEQLASRPLAALAGALFHPAFHLARPLRTEARP